ncbi:UDP-glucose 4-epimerase-like [Mytilus trossulus]|uniref:UDP-glucose 4-epimerase-like n=1 Tax=Mytilus trossulus TaxID=6551 RepID=UPI0030041ED9
MSRGCILVTGGAGFVGSHSVIELINAGYSVVVVDNFVNANNESVKRVEEICGTSIPIYNLDLTNKSDLEDVFKKHEFTSVIHFAGLKNVGESCEVPLLYYNVNVGGAINLLEVMKENNVKNLIFSSSCTVYGDPKYLPVDENHPTGGCTNPYGRTKFFIEEILKDLCIADPDWNIVVLRYFNPVGAHKSGKIGEDPKCIPNLMPYCAQILVGKRKELNVYGNDYDTPDGTGVRDYIHVSDVATGHVAAQKKVEEKCGLKIYNLGTGQGYSVMEMIKAFSEAAGKPVQYKITGRRAGDVASTYSKPDLAAKELGWKATRGLSEMCEDLWRWQTMNPDGFNSN